MRGFGTKVLAIAAAGLLAACSDLPDPRPQPARPVTPTPQPPSAESVALKAYYARVERGLTSQGMLRIDPGRDIPFSARTLATNFVRIALFDEYIRVGNRYEGRQSESRLRRWEGPIRMRVTFGASTPEARKAEDLRNVTEYTGRLSRLTGLPIRVTDTNSNFEVLFLNEDERRASADLIRELIPGISNTAVNTIVELPRNTFCLVFAFSEGPSDVYTRALAVVRSEHPDRLRLSCIHEELAQAMGLANDSQNARPSIFNDDEEFGLLTKHDELLLRILYDKRLRPGMTSDAARPIVETISQELVADET